MFLQDHPDLLETTVGKWKKTDNLFDWGLEIQIPIKSPSGQILKIPAKRPPQCGRVIKAEHKYKTIYLLICRNQFKDLIRLNCGGSCFLTFSFSLCPPFSSAELLQQVHAIGKASKNIFSATQNFSSFTGEEDPASHSPVISFKAHLVRLIGNLCHGNISNQNKVWIMSHMKPVAAWSFNL